MAAARLTAPTLITASARRLAPEGVTPAAADGGSRRSARARPTRAARAGSCASLDAAGLRRRVGAGAPADAGALRGAIVRGPMVGAQHAYALVRDWLGAPAPTTTATRRWPSSRAGTWPVTARPTSATWRGGRPAAARRARGHRAIASELRERDDGLLELRATDQTPAPLPPPRLLGAFDPLLLGWCSRAAHPRRPQADRDGQRPVPAVRTRKRTRDATWTICGGEGRLKRLRAHRACRRARAAARRAGTVVRYLRPGV